MPRVDLNKKLNGKSKSTPESSELNKEKKFAFRNPKTVFEKKKKNPLEKIASPKKKKVQTEESERPDYAALDSKLVKEELEKQKAEARDNKRQDIKNKIITALLIAGCIYLVFLIFGVINTQYMYDESGHVVAQRMTVEKIEALENFNEYALQYRQARTLYEEVLVLDYRMGAGEEDPSVIAPEYETLLESINQLAIQVTALELPSEYTQTVSMLESWVKTDIAVYCQSMSKAITQNDAESAELALEYKNNMYNNFSAVTQSTVVIGQQVTGADISDILEWSPESYIQETIGGIVNYEQ